MHDTNITYGMNLYYLLFVSKASTDLQDFRETWSCIKTRYIICEQSYITKKIFNFYVAP